MECYLSASSRENLPSYSNEQPDPPHAEGLPGSAGNQRRVSYFLFFIIVLGGSLTSRAQLCNGSLGDPVVHIDFGTLSNPQTVPPLTGYTYQSTPCPDDGFYTITASSPSCFNNSWHVVSRDHTGNGLFMLVNATFTPGDFFVQRISGLCPGTTYEFAAWVMNMIVYNSIKPNLRFTIETTAGAVLQSYTTGDIPETTSPLWKQYGFFFTTPANATEVVLRIRNNAPGGIGNDIAIDDITFRPCGPQLNAHITGSMNQAWGCEGQPVSFPLEADVTQGFTNPSFQWQISRDTGKTWQDIPGATQRIYTATPVQVGLYQYRFASAEAGNIGQPNCRIASDAIDITIVEKPVVDAGPDRSIFPGDTITIQATATRSDLTYSWSPPDDLADAFVLTPRSFTSEERTYTLTITTPEGCTNQDSMRVLPLSGIHIPTAFSPNADGLNDRWRIPGIDPATGAVVTVYNKYGQEVYRVEDDLVNWDGTMRGKPQPAGAYVYVVRYKNGRPTEKGTLMLIR